jgi:hypothetical protein
MTIAKKCAEQNHHHYKANNIILPYKVAEEMLEEGTILKLSTLHEKVFKENINFRGPL